MNEYQVAFSVSGVVFCCIILAYILSWVCQRAWAWIDDSKSTGGNWLIKKTTFSKWKYPVYNEYGDGLRRAVENNETPFGYAKDKKNNNGRVGYLKEGVDYVYNWDLRAKCFPFVFAASALPVVSLIAFNFYPVTLFILSAASIAFLARFAMRSKKLFNKHVADKDAHKE